MQLDTLIWYSRRLKNEVWISFPIPPSIQLPRKDLSDQNTLFPHPQKRCQTKMFRDNFGCGTLEYCTQRPNMIDTGFRIISQKWNTEFWYFGSLLHAT